MLKEKDVFFTTLRKLGDKYIYPFHLNIYHPLKRQCFLFLEANIPLSEEKRKLLSHFEKKGAKLAVRVDQRLTFDRYLKDIYDQDFSLSENLWQIDEIIKETKVRKQNKDCTQAAMNKEFQNSLASNDFIKFIRRIQLEILVLDLPYQQLYLAKILSLHFLNKDSPRARVIALNFLLSSYMKNLTMTDRLDSFLASCLCDLGELKLARKLVITPNNLLDSKNKQDYQMHLKNTPELLADLKIVIPDLTARIIFEHHERADGSGYPNKKTIRQTHVLSLALALIVHLVEFSEGQVINKKVPLREVVELYKKRDSSSGLQIEFSFPIYQALLKVFEENLDLSA